MQNDHLNTLRNIWNSIVKTNEDSEPDYQLNFDHLLQLFHVGDFYYYIFNLQTSTIEYVHPNVEYITGIPAKDYTPEKFISVLHPEDYTNYLNSEATAIEFALNFDAEKLIKYKIRNDFRIIKPSGEIIRILYHIHPLQISKANGIIRCLGIQSDITFLKPVGKSILSFIGMHGEPSYIDIDIVQKFKPTNEILTRREKEILKLLYKGESSKQVAYELHLSEATVNTHRRNILNKTHSNSIQEVIYKAIENGWI